MLPLTEVPVPAYSAAKQACLCVSVCVCVTLKYIAYFLLGRMFVLSCHAVALDVIHVYTEIVSTRRVNDTVPCDVLCLYQQRVPRVRRVAESDPSQFAALLRCRLETLQTALCRKLPAAERLSLTTSAEVFLVHDVIA